MNGFLASCLLLLGPAAFAAAPLENAAATAARLGADVAAPDASAIASPASEPADASLSPARASGSISADATAKGEGPVNCAGGRWDGWIRLRADVRVSVPDGATAQVPVSGSVWLSGSCQRGGSGFAYGSATLSGAGGLYKDGRRVGAVSLSGDVSVNQYLNGTFAWISQGVSLSGTYDESAAPVQ